MRPARSLLRLAEYASRRGVTAVLRTTVLRTTVLRTTQPMPCRLVTLLGPPNVCVEWPA